MCMALYVGATGPLATIGWDESSPAFNVQAVRDLYDPVRRQFTTPHVYYLGAHTGCSCGFGYDEVAADSTNDDATDWAAGRRSVALLRAYLIDAVQQLGEVELFACWEGDQGEAPEHKMDVTPDFFGGEAFSLPEKAKFRVRPSSLPLQPTSDAKTKVE
jgi:hypothetical protein